MDLLHLEHFKTVAELEHITAAASQLHVAQPSLSRTVKKLEEELGFELFDRRGKNIYLNKYGRTVLEHANIILDEVKAIPEHLKEISDDSDRTVFFSIYAATKLLPKLIKGFKEENPDIKLYMIEQSLRGDIEDKCTLSIYSTMRPVSAPNVVTLLEEDILLGVPKDNPLSQASSLRLGDVAKENFICLQKGKSLREIADSYCALAGFSPNVILESDSPSIVRQLINAGIGIAFIPSLTWLGMNDGQLNLIPISYPSCKRFIQMKWRSSGYVSEAQRLFGDYVINFFKKLAEENTSEPTSSVFEEV